MVPASKSSIELLETIESDERNNNNDCFVCLDEIGRLKCIYLRIFFFVYLTSEIGGGREEESEIRGEERRAILIEEIGEQEMEIIYIIPISFV